MSAELAVGLCFIAGFLFGWAFGYLMGALRSGGWK